MTQTDLKTQPTSVQPQPADAAPTYPLGRGDAETRRLMLQHQIYGPLTRRLFEAAGIGAGMRVLDIGSGAGDVSLLLADLVGPRGRVTGVDLNGEILQTARARVQAASWQNVTFHARRYRSNRIWSCMTTFLDIPPLGKVRRRALAAPD